MKWWIWLIVIVVSFGCGVGATFLAFALGLFQPETVDLEQRENWGKFSGLPKLEMQQDGRNARVIEDFVYIDPHGKPWIAPEGSLVNGASIPKPFWSIVGGPLDGQYRNASIIHDVACEKRIESWQSVHTNFYEACRCGGVPVKKAKILFAAVFHFGPRWELQETNVSYTLSLEIVHLNALPLDWQRWDPQAELQLVMQETVKVLTPSKTVNEISDAEIEKIKKLADSSLDEIKAFHFDR